MKKHKENIFAQKFRLLSSQGSEDIHWSSSESSDFENVSINTADKVTNFGNKKTRKRKRKKTLSKNISNLDITVVDVTKDHKDAKQIGVSNISIKKPKVENSGSKSPILGSTQYFPPYTCKNVSTSPILSSKTLGYQSTSDVLLKSPIIVLKTASPRVSPNVKKKLFDYGVISEDTRASLKNSNTKSVMNDTNDCLDKRKYIEDKNYYQSVNRRFKTIYNQDASIKLKTNENQVESRTFETIDSVKKENRVLSKNKSLSREQNLFKDIKTEPFVKTVESNLDIEDLSQEKTNEEICVIAETPELNMDDTLSMLKTSNINLAKKIKNYFDNQFSSENPSQQTISEVSTPKNSSKTSDDVEIISTITQVMSNVNSNESIKQEDAIIDTDKKEKKIRYKKDGLAYRLNKLLKKQTASISLWQHERFLAANSNFVIPKEEFIAFRVFKVNSKYGCQILEAVDLNDDNYLILINSCHSNVKISTDCIIKLYEPYTKLDFHSNCKLIINVTKFECVPLK